MAPEVFSEYLECYGNWDFTSSLLLREAPTLRDILKLDAGGISLIWRNGKMRAAGINRAQALVEAVQESGNLEAREVARLEIRVLVNNYILKAEQIKRLDEYLEGRVKEVANVEKLFAIKEIGLNTVIGFA